MWRKAKDSSSQSQKVSKDKKVLFENKTIIELREFQDSCSSLSRKEVFERIGILDKKLNQMNFKLLKVSLKKFTYLLKLWHYKISCGFIFNFPK